MLMADTGVSAPGPRDVMSDAEVAHFNEAGFVVPQVGLPPEDAAFMRETVERVFRDNPGWAGIVRQPHVPIRPGQLEGVVGGEICSRLRFIPLSSRRRGG